MNIYKLGNGEILAVLTDNGVAAKRFTVADIPGYPDDLATASAYLEAEIQANPDDLVLFFDTEPSEIIHLPASGDLATELTAAKERLDMSALGQQVQTELNWLSTTIGNIDGYAVAEVRNVVKRLAQENEAILKALRYIVRQLL